MTRTLCIFSAAIISTVTGYSQSTLSRPVFSQGQKIDILVDVKTKVSQEAMGNAIDFTSDGTALHTYTVTNTTADNTTLHHDVKKITFHFDGMGQKRSFDSDNKKDMDGLFGPSIKDILSKSYDMIIDPAGKVLMVKPEKIELSKTDDRLAIVFNLLGNITGVVYPPRKGEPGFFQRIPDSITKVGQSWTRTEDNAGSVFTNMFVLTAINDTVLLVDVKGKGNSVTKSEVMGMQAVTSLATTYTGTMAIDRQTGMLREETLTIDSNGTTDVMGSSMPVMSKSTLTTRVVPAQAAK